MSDARIVDHPLVHADGIYFGLPEAEHHNALALSASGIKLLRISTLDWWVRSPLNPDRADEETEPQKLGKAFHKRIVEGAAVFAEHYAPELDPGQYPYALRTNADLIDALAQHLIKPRSGARKADLIEQLRAVDPHVAIWDEIVRDHQAQHLGKVFLNSPWVARIEQAARMIENHAQLGRAFTGGRPEVSVFWHDAESGIPMKARFDYLKPRAVVDLKSFENVYGMPLKRAIARSIANYRYHVQAALYLEAAEVAKRLILDNKVYGEDDWDWLGQVYEGEKTWLWVFQQRGAAPVARGVVLSPGIALDLGAAEIIEAKEIWARAWQRWGSEPWLDEADIDTFDVADLPAYISQ